MTSPSTAAPSESSDSPRPAARRTTADIQPTAALGCPGAAHLYWHAGVRARTNSPSVADLKRDGWTVEHENRWGGALCRKDE